MRVCSGTRRFSSPACSSRTQHRHGGPRRLKARAAAAAIDGFLSNAEEKLQNNNRIGALREWDKALKEENLTQQQRKVLLYNQVNVYAQMGDVELAQVPLREALSLGLNFEQAVASPEEGMVPWRSSQQVIITLKRFAAKVEAKEVNLKKKAPYNPARGVALTPAGLRSALAEADVGNLLGTEMKDDNMDKSLVGIAKRVALLLVVLIVVGVGLFYGGLTLMFPDGV